VQQRVARLERERRAWRIGVGAVVAGLFLAGATASPGVDEVRARRIVVVDAQGTERAFLGLGLDGSPELALRDAQGKERAFLTLGTGGSPWLALRDARGKGQAILSVLPGEGPGLALRDAQGKERIALDVLRDRNPRLALLHAQGKDRAILGAAELEGIRTGVAERRPESSLVLFDANGTVLWRAP